MKELKGACVVAQSGGPTSAINASAYGVISAALKNPAITAVYGAANGIKGILNDKLYDLGQEDEKELALMPQTPSSILGSCRYKLKNPEDDATDYERILEIFEKYDVRYFFLIGGNDSMDTCNKVSKFLQAKKFECRVMGVPKTIDNDLFGTDHCPGYGSAAKYVATTCMEVKRDACVYDYPTMVVCEVMGRNAGWLTAAAALGNTNGQGADLIYLPEVDFSMDKFLSDVKRVFEEKGSCVIAVSEGIHDKDGKLIAEYGTSNAGVDSFGHKQLGGAAATLVAEIKASIGIKKIRSIELSLLQRCAAHYSSKTDLDESFLAGKTALEKAVAGETDKMVCFARKTNSDGEYACEMTIENLSLAANQEKTIPLSWINEEGNNVTDEFVKYALPLIQGETEKVYQNGLLRFANLKKVIVSK